MFIMEVLNDIILNYIWQYSQLWNDYVLFDSTSAKTKAPTFLG